MAVGEGGFAKSRRMLTVAVSAEAVWQIVSKAMSSPQTAELDAARRAPTIWKWVKIAGAESAAWVAFFCWLDGSLWPALGGILAGGTTFWEYWHGINSGLNSTEPPKELY